MNTTFDVLVIILSVLLAIFLILSVVIGLVVLKVVKAVHRVVERGEAAIDSAEAAVAMFSKAAAPAGAIRSVMNIVNLFSKSKKKGAK